MGERIDALVGVELFEPGQEAGGEVSVADPPFLNEAGAWRRRLVLDLLEIFFRQRVSQPMVQTDIGLEMVMDFRAQHSIKNGIDMGLPLIRGFEIPKE